MYKQLCFHTRICTYIKYKKLPVYRYFHTNTSRKTAILHPHCPGQKQVLSCESGEILALVAKGSCGLPISGSAQGHAGWSFKQPALVEGIPAHDKGVGTTWSLRSLQTQTILHFLWFCNFTTGQVSTDSFHWHGNIFLYTWYTSCTKLAASITAIQSWNNTGAIEANSLYSSVFMVITCTNSHRCPGISAPLVIGITHSTTKSLRYQTCLCWMLCKNRTERSDPVPETQWPRVKPRYR